MRVRVGRIGFEVFGLDGGWLGRGRRVCCCSHVVIRYDRGDIGDRGDVRGGRSPVVVSDCEFDALDNGALAFGADLLGALEGDE